MKKWICALCALLIVPALALADGEKLSVSELREQAEALGRWTKTYEAHGRTIEVDVPVIIPDVDCIPITTVSSFPPYEERELEDSEQFIEIEKSNVRARYFENIELQATMIIPERYDTVRLQVDSPGEKRSVANSNDFLKYERVSYYPWEIDDSNTVFAEENDMSLGEAFDFIEETVDRLYGENDGIAIDYIEVRSRARKTKNVNDLNLGDTVEYYPSGTYFIHLCQMSNGVPVYAYPFQLFDPYKLADKRMSDEAYMPLNCLLMEAEVMNLQSYSMLLSMMKKQDVVDENPTLAPVSKVIGELEKEIEAGRIRNVYSLRLGYACYLSRDGEAPYTLYPTWICECDYTQTAKEDGSFYFEGEGIREGSKFALVGVNAVTGELFDRRAPSQELIYCPE